MIANAIEINSVCAPGIINVAETTRLASRDLLRFYYNRT